MASSFATATAVNAMSAKAKLQRSQRLSSMVQFGADLWTKLGRVQQMDDQNEAKVIENSRCAYTLQLP